MNILNKYVRPVNPETDKDLPVYSHSKIEQYLNCPFAYYLKYNEEKKSGDTSLALELGSLLHKLLEIKGKWIHDGIKVNETKLFEIMEDGYYDENEHLRGIKELKKSYLEDWYAHNPNNITEKNYEEKIELFRLVLHNEMQDSEWEPVYFELPFEFVWNNRCIIHGYIDRVDVRNGDYKVIDYKTNKKVFEDSKVKTSQQFSIYACAMLAMFGKLPVEFEYDFILLDKRQKALSTGWEKRFIKKLENSLDKIDESNRTNIFTPRPCPLCYWCSYSQTNPNSKEYKYECDYFSLWTPTDKSFKKNKEYNASEYLKDKLNNGRRKLFF